MSNMQDENQKNALSRLEAALASLDRRYRYAMSEDSEKGFFLGVSDYVEVIEKSEVLRPLIKITVIDEREKILQERQRLEDVVIVEAKATYDELRKIIREKKIKSPYIDQAFKEYEDLMSGRKQMSGPMAENVYNDVRDVLLALQQAERKDIADQYAIYNKHQILIGWKIADTYKDFQAVEKELKKQLDIAVWGAWNELWWAYACIHKQDELWKEWAKERPGLSMNMLNASSLFDEMNLIMEGKRVDQLHHFLVPVFKRHLSRLHNNLLDEAQRIEDEFNSPSEILGPITAEVRGNLLFMNEQNIPLRTGSKQLDICRVLFKNSSSMSKTWESAEILEEVDSEYFDSDGKLKSKYKRVVYSAIEKLQIKILTILGVPDYFDFGISTVRINPKYLKK